MLREFKKFILRGNVVDLAVGIVIGAAFTAVINSLVQNIITPLIAAIYGQKHFTDAKFIIHNSEFRYGEVFNSIITFFIVAAVIFFLVVQPVNRLTARMKTSRETEDSATMKCPYCLSEIPKAATKCKFCTSTVKSAAKTT